MKNPLLRKYFSKEKFPFLISSIWGLLSLFLFFMPFLYSLDRSSQPVFVNGYDMLKFMEDSYTNIHYGVIFFLIGYVFSGFLLLFGILGTLGKKETFRSFFAMIFTISLFQTGFEIAAMVLLSGCQKMNLYLEFGSFFSVIFKGVLFLFLIGYFIYLRISKTKAS